MKPQTVTVETALKELRSGHRVFIGSGAAEPQYLVGAFSKAVEKLADVEVVHILTLGTAPYSDRDYKGKVRLNALFIGANIRDTVSRGMGDYTPCFLHEVPRLFHNKKIPLDVALIQVTPPRNGFVSLGVAVDVVKAAAESADIVIAQVNPSMPWTQGDSYLPVDEIDYLVEHTEPILELPQKEITPCAAWIGRYIAHLVEDGSTLQLGIGAIPDAALAALSGKRNLGVHSEMVSDGILPLIESGVINGREKTLHKNRIVASFCMGSRKLYDVVNDNPLFEFHPSDFVNDPFVIAQNSKMVSINSALQIDLTGQVAADSIGNKFYSGVGGQVDFIRGATGSPGGKSIIALPSTAKSGAISRIVPTLSPGTGVVTSRADVDFVVTEYGICSLKGHTVRERAIGLIQISHPDHRKALLDDAIELGYISADQALPLTADRYQVDLEATVTLGKREFFVRPVRPTDEKKLKDLFYTQSEDTTYKRFGVSLKSLSDHQFQELVAIDYLNKLAIGVFQKVGASEELVAVGRYYLMPDKISAEVAFTVRDDVQGRGIGVFLVNYLAWIATQRGIERFHAQALRTNSVMRHIFHTRFRNTQEETRQDSVEFIMSLKDRVEQGNPVDSLAGSVTLQS